MCVVVIKIDIGFVHHYVTVTLLKLMYASCNTICLYCKFLKLMANFQSHQEFLEIIF